jgi:hypothetical protein
MDFLGVGVFYRGARLGDVIFFPAFWATRTIAFVFLMRCTVWEVVLPFSMPRRKFASRVEFYFFLYSLSSSGGERTWASVAYP